MATILLMNSSGKQSPKVNRDVDIIGTRKNARRDIILQTKASVVLLQESDINIDSFLPRTGRYPKFGCLGSRSAAILFRTQIFETTGCASLRREISKLCDELEKTSILATENEVMSRLCVGQLQMLKNDLKFLFISWSGPAFADVQKRKVVLKDMLTLVDMYMVGKPVYLLIGGDFNLRHDEVLHILKEFQSYFLCECSKKDRYQNNTSFFITSQPMAAMIGDVHVVEVNALLGYKFDVPEHERSYVLNHNPLYINLHL